MTDSKQAVSESTFWSWDSIFPQLHGFTTDAIWIQDDNFQAVSLYTSIVHKQQVIQTLD